MKSLAPLPESATVPSITRPAAASAPVTATGGGQLTADDYLAIRALAHTYAYGLDTGADKGSLYASVFTEDAEFHGPPAVRRQAVRRQGTRSAPPVCPRRSRFGLRTAFHDQSPDRTVARGARGKVYLLVIDIAQSNKPTSVNMGGHYEDVYVKTAAGWRIKTGTSSDRRAHRR